MLQAALGLRKRIGIVKNTRTIGKKDLIHNHYQPHIEVDPQTYSVRADGLLLTCEPADVFTFCPTLFFILKMLKLTELAPPETESGRRGDVAV